MIQQIINIAEKKSNIRYSATGKLYVYQRGRDYVFEMTANYKLVRSRNEPGILKTE